MTAEQRGAGDGGGAEKRGRAQKCFQQQGSAKDGLPLVLVAGMHDKGGEAGNGFREKVRGRVLSGTDRPPQRQSCVAIGWLCFLLTLSNAYIRCLWQLSHYSQHTTPNVPRVAGVTAVLLTVFANLARCLGLKTEAPGLPPRASPVNAGLPLCGPRRQIGTSRPPFALA